MTWRIDLKNVKGYIWYSMICSTCNYTIRQKSVSSARLPSRKLYHGIVYSIQLLRSNQSQSESDKCRAKNIPKSLMQTSWDIPLVEILSSNIEGSTLLVWSSRRRCIIQLINFVILKNMVKVQFHYNPWNSDTL